MFKTIFLTKKNGSFKNCSLKGSLENKKMGVLWHRCETFVVRSVSKLILSIMKVMVNRAFFQKHFFLKMIRNVLKFNM